MPLSSKLLEHPMALCNTVRRIACEAGEIILEYFEDCGYKNAETKSDGSPVTAADRAAEAHIEKALHKLLPEVPMIGEESYAEGRAPDISDAPYFWLVDALDGTKEFISGSGNFTVNIALIHQGDPVMGVVYVPVSGILYAGAGEGTAFRWSEDTGKDKGISVRVPPEKGLTVATSASHGSSARLDEFLSEFKVEKIVKRGSSLKICSIAEGKADIYPRLAPTCEWDTAAGDAVLRAAGGMITDTDGKPLRYGGLRPKFLNPEFVASGFDWYLP